MEPEELKQLDQLHTDYFVFRKGPVAADLIGMLTQQRELALAAAEEETDPVKAVSRLQNASAYKTILTYIESMSVPDR